MTSDPVVHVSAEHPPWEDANGNELPVGPTPFDLKVARRLEQLAADRTARRILAEDEAVGLFGGFSGDTLDARLAEERNPTPWLVEGLMRQGHKVLLTAGFKCGKTTLLGNVARAFVDQEPLFGRFPVRALAGTVSIYDFEMSEDDSLDMYARMNITNTGRIAVENLVGSGFSLANDVHAEMAVKHLLKVEAEVWFIDTFARAMRGFGDENSNSDVARFLHTVDQVVAETDLRGVVVTAHTGRNQQEVGSEHARGATFLDDDAHARWLLTRDESGTRYFRAEGRNRVGCAEFALAFDEETELLSATNRTRTDGRNEKAAREAAQLVNGSPDGISVNELKAAMQSGRNNGEKGRGIDYAAAQGWVQKLADPADKRRVLVVPGPTPLVLTLKLGANSD
jgi:hypothetical protein